MVESEEEQENIVMQPKEDTTIGMPDHRKEAEESFTGPADDEIGIPAEIYISISSLNLPNELKRIVNCLV